MSESNESFKVLNEAELVALLNSIVPELRKNALTKALRQGAKVINTQAKQNLIASKKGKSKTGYKYYASAFKTANLKGRTIDEIRLKVGIQNPQYGYKLRWLEFGTNIRETRKGFNRGKITGTNFFFNAVRSTTEAVYKAISDSLIKSLEGIVKKS